MGEEMLSMLFGGFLLWYRSLYTGIAAFVEFLQTINRKGCEHLLLGLCLLLSLGCEGSGSTDELAVDSGGSQGIDQEATFLDATMDSPNMNDQEIQTTDIGLPVDCAADMPWLEVPIRFHLLRSEILNLNATFSENQISTLLADAQQLWNQACIRLVIEAVVENRLTPMQEMDYIQRKDELEASGFRQLMLDVMPRSNLLRPGWNVMVFRAFERFSSGVYFSEIPSVLFAERLPEAAGSGLNPPIILAHEIGHALSLRHYEGADVDQNLMNVDIMQNQMTGTYLTPSQIEQARASAQSGDTFLE